MRFTAATALAMATTVSAHAQMYGVWVNGKDQGDGRKEYIRSPNDNGPVKDLTSSDIACNVNGATAVPKFVKAAAGDELSFEWYHDNRDDDIIDGSHLGPLITYIAPYKEGMDGTGAIWSKIDELGYDGKEWAVDKIKASHGKYDFTLPSSLKAGKYMIRQEIIAHHESDKAYSEDPARGAQFYPACVQFEVTGSGSAVPDEAFDFNKGYTYEDPGIVYNLYGSDANDYKIPGPSVWSGSGSSGSGSGSAPKPSATKPAAAPSAPAAEEPSAPAATQPAAGNDNGNASEPEAPAPTFSTVVRPAEPTAPAATEEASAPVATKTPKTGCSSRRRRRRSAKHL